MKSLSRIGVTLIVAALLLALADRILQPVPIPAGTAVFGALLSVWLMSEPRVGWTVAGFVLGGLAGMSVHLLVHLTGGSTRPDEGVLAHVSANGIWGLAVGAAVFLPVASVAWLLRPNGALRTHVF